MRFIFLLILVAGCIKFPPKKDDSLPVALKDLQGTWELCTSSGGTDGDYRLTHQFIDKTYYYTETYYSSKDGSCTGALTQITGAHTIELGTGSLENFPEATALDITFTTNRKITLLSATADGSTRVQDCSGESSPVVGTSYDVTQTYCGWPIFVDDAVVAGMKEHAFILVDHTKTPKTISLSHEASASEGSSPTNRHTLLMSGEYPKK